MSSHSQRSKNHYGKNCLTENDAYRLASRLVPLTCDPLWGQGARAILVALILKLQAENGSDWEKADLIALASQPKKLVLRDVEKYLPAAANLLREGERVGEGVLIHLLMALGIDETQQESAPLKSTRHLSMRLPRKAQDDQT